MNKIFSIFAILLIVGLGVKQAQATTSTTTNGNTTTGSTKTATPVSLTSTLPSTTNIITLTNPENGHTFTAGSAALVAMAPSGISNISISFQKLDTTGYVITYSSKDNKNNFNIKCATTNNLCEYDLAIQTTNMPNGSYRVVATATYTASGSTTPITYGITPIYINIQNTTATPTPTTNSTSTFAPFSSDSSIPIVTSNSTTPTSTPVAVPTSTPKVSTPIPTPISTPIPTPIPIPTLAPATPTPTMIPSDSPERAPRIEKVKEMLKVNLENTTVVAYSPAPAVQNSPASPPVIGTNQTALRLFGSALPNEQVKIQIHSDPIIITTMADSLGNWSYTLTDPLDAGQHSLTISVVDPLTSETVSNKSNFVIATAEAAGSLNGKSLLLEDPTTAQIRNYLEIAGGIILVAAFLLIIIYRRKQKLNISNIANPIVA